MYTLITILLAAGMLPTQEVQEAMGATEAHSNDYIQEEWSYFAERLRNEFMALCEREVHAEGIPGNMILSAPANREK